jgi:hypothetical protein
LTTPRVLVYFEGNKYGSEGMDLFEEKVKHAAGRLQTDYPTIAKAWLPTEDFEVVGTYEFTADWSRASLTITDEARLAAWLA